MAGDELEITADVSDALGWVLGAAPTSPEPLVLLATYLDALAKGYGLSESRMVVEDPLERAAAPAGALPVLRHYLAYEGADLDADCLRDRLYTVLVDLAESHDARKTLNRNRPLTEVELLTAGQVYWNLEGTKDRPRLPIRPGPISKVGTTGRRQIDADMPTPDRTRDFATMTWTARVNEPGPNKSKGQGFRKQGARLAVLAAQHIIDINPHLAPALDGASLIISKESAPPRIVAIVWPEEERVLAASVLAPTQTTEPLAAAAASAVLEQSRAVVPEPDTPTVVLGALADVGADYQRRGFDDVLDRMWADGGDRRVWLRGGPGLGKTYSARRVMQQARADQSPEREVLLLWVDSADDAAVIEAFAAAADRLRYCGVTVPVGIDDPPVRKAQALLRVLATSTWRWLIVLDNADAGALLDAGLIPTGTNHNGRVLLTTRSRDHRISSHGRPVDAALFTPEEATAYLRSEVHSHTGGAGALTAAATETSRLAEAVAYHPLALSIAAGTIVSNAMSVADWLDEFASAPLIDSAADEPDRGGYPHLISATWQIALEQASQGLPDGVVQRAAMVAAIQDPAGHPTWLWSRDDVSRWVAGGPALARRHGVPVAIQRLIDSGVLELRGETWKHGQVAIHRLAARAVREQASTTALVELAGILANEWLLRLTANREEASDADIRRNLHPIAALPHLATPTRQAATALLSYAQPESVTMHQEAFEDMAPYLTRGGALGLAMMAVQLIFIGDAQEDLGLLDEARATRKRAAETYRQVLEDPSLDDELRSIYLANLALVEDQLDETTQADEHRRHAARILERLTQTTTDTTNLLTHLAALAHVHAELGNQDERARVLDRAAALPIPSPAHDPTSTDRAPTTADGQAQEKLGKALHTLGRVEDAKECLVQATQTYDQLDNDSERNDVLRLLARLHITSADWAAAEACLGRVTSGDGAEGADHLLLSSVQRHLGRRNDAEQNLARAAEKYGDPSSDAQSPTEGLPPGFAEQLSELLLEMRVLGRYRALHMVIGQALKRERWEDATGLLESILDYWRERSQGRGADHDTEAELATAHEQVGSTGLLAGRPDKAVLHFRQAGTIRQLLVDLAPGDTEAQTDLALNLASLGTCHYQLGQLEEALEVLARSAAIYRRIADQAPDNRATQDMLANVLYLLGHTYAGLGDREQSLTSLRGRVNILQMLAELAPDDAHALSSLAGALYDAGRTCLRDLDQPEEALQWLTRAEATYRDHLTRFGPAAPSTRGDLADALELLGLATSSLDRLDETLRYLSEAVDIRRGLAADAPDALESQLDLARDLGALGAVHLERDELDQAETYFTSSSTTLQLLADLEPGEYERMLISALRGLAETLTRLGKTEDADKAAARADTLEEKYPDPDG